MLCVMEMVHFYEKIVKYCIHRKITRKTLDFFGKEVIILFSTRGTRVLTHGYLLIMVRPQGRMMKGRIFIMTIRPLSDRVVLKMVEAEETTASGFILTSASKEKPQIAEVISVGPGGIVDGEKVEMTVKPGDKVLMSKYAGTEVKVDGEEYVIVRVGDILAVCE